MEEVIVLYGPRFTGRWTLPQAGQAEFAGIDQDGLDRYKVLRAAAKAGRTPQGLAIEKVFLAKHRSDKGIEAPTAEEEKARTPSWGHCSCGCSCCSNGRCGCSGAI